jgi:hypothetical protein
MRVALFSGGREARDPCVCAAPSRVPPARAGEAAP